MNEILLYKLSSILFTAFIYTMTIDRFGRAHKLTLRNSSQSRLLTLGYTLSADGSIDIQKRRITNLHLLPEADSDVTSKHYVDALRKEVFKEFRTALYQLSVTVNKQSLRIDTLEKAAYNLEIIANKHAERINKLTSELNNLRANIP